MKKTLVFILAISINVASFEDTQKECYSKKLQMMMPEYPYTNYQGYALINFDVNEEGNLKNISAVESKCAISRKDDGSIEFRKCPFFKTNSIQAAKYIKYSPPVDTSGNPCTLKNQSHRYTYSLYKRNVKDLNFLLRDEFYEMRKNEKQL